MLTTFVPNGNSEVGCTGVQIDITLVLALEVILNESSKDLLLFFSLLTDKPLAIGMAWCRRRSRRRQ